MEYHQTQKIVASDTTRFRVVNCGRQWGKTFLSVWEMISCAFAKSDRRVGYFATTHGQAREIAWSLLKKHAAPILADTPNETRLELKVYTQDKGISEIVLKGWESVETARGTQFDLLVLDEVAKMRNFDEGWQAVLMATLAFRQGKALFISTPYGYNHFHRLYLKGENNSKDWSSHTFTSLDNPHLSKDYLESVRADVTPDYWNQEYMAQFTTFTGLVYREFDQLKHIKEFEHTFNENGEYIFGLDFAVRGWTASTATVAKPDGKYYLLDTYKELGGENVTAKVHAENIKDMLLKYAPLDKWTGYADPAGWSKTQQSLVDYKFWAIADEYLEAGLPIVPANNDVIAGINHVRQLFQADKIVIHPRNTAAVDELMQYQWKQQASSASGEREDPEAVRKINDHVVDSFRYLLYSKTEAPAVLPYKPGQPIVFGPPKIEETDKDDDVFSPLNTSSLYD